MSSRPDVRPSRSAASLLISVHDVTPALERPVRTLWSLCRALDVVPALLVVPNWHGASPLAARPDFVEWLRACAQDGAEMVLHGERHDEAGLPRGWRDSLRAMGRTAREGEFLTLHQEEAASRIDRGLTALRSLGIEPMGFVPPAWLAREATHEAVARAGLLMSEDAGAIRLHQGGVQATRVIAPALRWSGRSGVRAHVSKRVAEWRWRAQQDVAVLRMALHPQDLAHPVTAESLRRELARWVTARRVVRYADLHAQCT